MLLEKNFKYEIDIQQLMKACNITSEMTEEDIREKIYSHLLFNYEGIDYQIIMANREAIVNVVLERIKPFRTGGITIKDLLDVLIGFYSHICINDEEEEDDWITFSPSKIKDIQTLLDEYGSRIIKTIEFDKDIYIYLREEEEA